MKTRCRRILERSTRLKNGAKLLKLNRVFEGGMPTQLRERKRLEAGKKRR